MQILLSAAKYRDTTQFYIIILALLTAPFFLNDFSSIFVKDWRVWLLIDYVGVKVFPLLVVLWLLTKKLMTPVDFGFTKQSIPSFAVLFVVVTFVGIFVDQNGYLILDSLPGYAPLGAMPAIKSHTWNWIDLTLGLLLVGIVEEIVFRGYMYTFLSRFTQDGFKIVAISSVFFGLIHWSLGLHSVIVTSIIGAIFMFSYMRTRMLTPIMLAHFAINFLDFSGVLPKSLFQLSN
jgi:hypothetical protein